jgi:Predicted N-acetylglucosaminyl transferase
MSIPYNNSLPEKSSTRDYSLLLAVVLGIMTIAGAYAMLPGTEEKAAAMISEGRPDEAIELLEKSQADGEFTSYERSLLADLYLGRGELPRAIELLEHLANDPLHAGSILPRLTAVYGQAHDTQRQLETARRLYDLRPTQALYQELRMLYRLTGDWQQERSLIDRATQAGHASPADTLRWDYLRHVPPEVMAATASWNAPWFTLPQLQIPGSVSQ